MRPDLQHILEFFGLGIARMSSDLFHNMICEEFRIVQGVNLVQVRCRDRVRLRPLPRALQGPYR